MKSKRKYIITALLFVACILSGIMFAATPGYKPVHIGTHAELDSLISQSLSDHSIQNSQIRVYTVRDDSTIHRKVYRVRVGPGFSKTSFHLQLHKQFFELGFNTPARVVFPERDMNIYFTYKGTVLRTVRLITDQIESENDQTEGATDG